MSRTSEYDIETLVQAAEHVTLSQETKEHNAAAADPTVPSQAAYSNRTKAQLRSLCRDLGLNATGHRDKLVHRLLHPEEATMPKELEQKRRRRKIKKREAAALQNATENPDTSPATQKSIELRKQLGLPFILERNRLPSFESRGAVLESVSESQQAVRAQSVPLNRGAPNDNDEMWIDESEASNSRTSTKTRPRKPPHDRDLRDQLITRCKELGISDQGSIRHIQERIQVFEETGIEPQLMTRAIERGLEKLKKPAKTTPKVAKKRTPRPTLRERRKLVSRGDKVSMGGRRDREVAPHRDKVDKGERHEAAEYRDEVDMALYESMNGLQLRTG